VAAPILVGVLRDTAGATSDEGIDAQLDAALRLAIDEVRSAGRLDREVALVYERGLGLPGGTAAAVERAYAELAARDVLLVVGPAIGDNALVATPLADATRLPTINWSGAGHARSEWMFELQVGSHEDEPVVLARHVAATGARRIAFVSDRSPIGRRYAAYFEAECDTLGLDVVMRRSVSPLADDLTGDVQTLRDAAPDAVVYLGLGVAGRVVGRARAAAGWDVPGFMGAAGMFGHTPGVAADIDGWTYIDVYSDRNTTLADVRARLGATFASGPGVAFGYDVGRLVAEGLARAPELTRRGVRDGLEEVKWVPAAEGHEGTHLTLGPQDHGALHGRYLVMRRWENGESIEVLETGALNGPAGI
jgi:ABC-type branched-subunit amino acid transport system substrate-binding protein